MQEEADVTFEGQIHEEKIIPELAEKNDFQLDAGVTSDILVNEGKNSHEPAEENKDATTEEFKLGFGSVEDVEKYYSTNLNFTRSDIAEGRSMTVWYDPSVDTATRCAWDSFDVLLHRQRSSKFTLLVRYVMCTFNPLSSPKTADINVCVVSIGPFFNNKFTVRIKNVLFDPGSNIIIYFSTS